ncbi:hypothetical protein EW146_g6669 [Bondarzewia mesenterica]|uniref:Hydrophobin n=1 Tax=Bondarzewia mesenterica TaxID=1095465 RepID=A0A4S4LN28_9AGAM|nr:hypothetical protein EW146_g6669 [Bondarzewia mesenterica]
MFVRVAILSAVMGFTAVVSAMPGRMFSHNSLKNQCNTGTVQCCNTIEDASSDNMSKMLAEEGLVIQGQNTPIGLNCDAFADDGGLASGSNCASQPVCCDRVEAGFAINCSPVNVVF